MKKYVCGDCPKRFRSKQALRNHGRDAHGKEAAQAVAAGKVCLWPTCSRRFDSAGALLQHMRDAHNYASFPGPDCPQHRVEMDCVSTSYGWLWVCTETGCDMRVGCHRGTRVPLGTPADAETRTARMQAHDAFDTLWQGAGQMKRHEAYAWLAQAMDLDPDDCHIGMFDRFQCDEVVRLVRARAVGPLRDERAQWQAVLHDPAATTAQHIQACERIQELTAKIELVDGC